MAWPISSRAVFFVGVLVLACVSQQAWATEESLSFVVDAGEYRVIETGEAQRIDMEGFGHLQVPGAPMVPSRTVLLALPPGGRVTAVEVDGLERTRVPGTFRLEAVPLVLPLTGDEQTTALRRQWESTRSAVYASDAAYPRTRGQLVESGGLRKYSWVAVSFHPFEYHPRSGRLFRFAGARVIVHFNEPAEGSREAREAAERSWDLVADARASRLFENFDQIAKRYEPRGRRPESHGQTHDYLIITTDALSTIVSGSGFVAWKEDLGFAVRVVRTSDPEIADQPGVDLAQKIRNFLRGVYAPWGVQYLLLVGESHQVPMRYCYPNPGNHDDQTGNPFGFGGEVPTDYYYADLTDPDELSWDSDGDGYFGEYGDDAPDFLAEIYVGRIPISISSRVGYALDKLVSYEQDTGAWKNQALQMGAWFFFANEDHSGWPPYDGTTFMAMLEDGVMSGWPISHYSEQGGLAPSSYPWPPLSEQAFTSDWRDGQYGVVNEGAHGGPSSYARKVWAWDDGDGVPETNNPDEMDHPVVLSVSSILEDDHPSVFCGVSCLIGYPEPNAYGRLGVDLLTRPGWGAAAGVVSATRIAYARLGWPNPAGASESVCYDFNRFMIDGPAGPMRVGEALYEAKFFVHQNYNLNSHAENWVMVEYNLYGDPAMVREGVDLDFSDGFESGDCSAWSETVE